MEAAGICGLEPSKCQVELTEVTFFGMKISKYGVRSDEKEVAALRNAKTPTNQASLNIFGLCGIHLP